MLAKSNLIKDTPIMNTYPKIPILSDPFFLYERENFEDRNGWTHYEQVPAVDGISLVNWLAKRILRRVRPSKVLNLIPERIQERTYLTPAGDLQIDTDIFTRQIVAATFITTQGLSGQAEEYRLDFFDEDIEDDEPAGNCELLVSLVTVERGGQDLFREFEILPLKPRDPIAVRLREFVELVEAVY